MSDTTYFLDETPQARAELRAGQYAGHANAEDLIRSHFASIPPEVRSGLRKAENVALLAQAKDDDAGAEIEVPDGCELIDWTIRGDDPRHTVISYVYETPDGRWLHGVQGYGDRYTDPAESPADKALREVAMHDAKVREVGIATNAEIEKRLAEHRDELNVQFGERFDALKSDLTDALEGLLARQNDAEKADRSTSGGNTQSSKRTDDSGESGAASGTKGTGDPDGTTSGGDDDASEVKWPHNHDLMDALAKKGGLTKKSDLPGDWDDLNLQDKQAFLESKGVKPEAQG